MTENLAKIPAKGILRKSSLTFIEHDDSEVQVSMESEKPTKVIVEPLETEPKEYEGETEQERARREEFEYKRKLYRHQEGMSVQLAKRLLSQEENIEEEADTITEDDVISVGSDDVVERNAAEDTESSEHYEDATDDDVTEIAAIGLTTTDDDVTEIAAFGLSATDDDVTEIAAIGQEAPDDDVTEIVAIGQRATSG